MRNLLSATSIFFLVLIVGISLWCFFGTPDKSISNHNGIPISTATKELTTTPSKLNQPPQIIRSVNPESKVAPNPILANPQAELLTSISDMAKLLKAGDLMTYAKTYIQTDQFAKNAALFEQAALAFPTANSGPQSPQLQVMTKRIQDLFLAMADIYDSLHDLVPSYNETRDMATYMVIPPFSTTGQLKPLVFVKIDGLWYLQDSDWASKK
jgi:hypothetical protein